MFNMSRLEQIGKNIKKFREMREISQEKLAEKVDLSREYIVRLERGQKSPSLKTVFNIADTLGVQLKDIFNMK